MRQKPPKPCNKPFSPCWCEERPNPPKCKDAVPIDGCGFASLALCVIFIFILIKKWIKLKC